MNRILCRAALPAILAGMLSASPAAFSDDDFVLRSENVAQRLGGADGIAAFISAKVVPALLDSELAPFFEGRVTRLTESTSQTVQCLARLLDHDRGGSSPKNGATVIDAAAAPDFPLRHVCRSSMSDVHRGMRINGAQFSLFISIVATEALNAGVAKADVQAVGKALERYRGSITQD